MKKLYLILALVLILVSGCAKKENEQNSNSSLDTSENVSETIPETTLEESDSSETESSLETETTTIAPTTTMPPTTTIAPTTTTAPTTTMAPTTTTAPTTIPTTTKKPVSKPEIEETTSKYFVEYTEDTSTTTSDYKYGLKKLAITHNYYCVYSDGSKEKYDSYTYDSYDCSGYNATDAELLSESNSKSSTNMTYYNEVLTLVNQIRAEAGVAPLTLDTTLCQAATMRAVEMNYSDLFSHTRPNGSSCFTVFDTYGITYFSCGENIAAGYASPAAVVEGWKNSSGHYANMINASYTKLGVGMSNEAPGSYGKYWVQLFTN